MANILEETGERYLPWSGDYITGYEHIHRYLFASRFVQEKRVLDISCGEGYGAAMMAQGAKFVVGVDIDAATIAHARLSYRHEHIHFVRADAQRFALMPGSIDIVVSFETLEHFTNHEAFLRAMKSSLTTSGILMISTPNRLVYREETEETNPFHKLELDRAAFLALLRRYFRHVQLFGQRLIATSVIAKSGERPFLYDTQQSRFLTTDIEPTNLRDATQIAGRIDPRYFIAICSDAPLQPLPNTVMVDGQETLYKDLVAHRTGWYELNSHKMILQAQATEMQAQATEMQAQATEMQAQVAEMQAQADETARQSEQAHSELMEIQRSVTGVKRRLVRTFMHLAGRSNSVSSAGEAILPTALIIIPGSMNYFYNQAGRRIAEALRSLGFIVEIATLESYTPREYHWCFIVNLYEVVVSDGIESRALQRIGDIQKQCNRVGAILLECVDTPWFAHTESLCEVADIPTILDFGFHDQSMSLGPDSRKRYRFVFNGLTETERRMAIRSLDERAEFPVEWMFVGHYSPARARLVSRLVNEFDPKGIVYMPKIAPVTEDGPHINEQQLSSVLSRTRYQIWCSHHEHFYVESERFRNSLLAGGLPIKVRLHPKQSDQSRLFDYLLFEEDEVATRLGVLDFDATRDRFVKEFLTLPMLEDGMVEALAMTGTHGRIEKRGGHGIHHP